MKQKRPQGRPVKWTEEESLKLANEILTWMNEADFNIYFERFLYEKKSLYPQLISELSEKWPSFSEAIKSVKKLQEVKIADLGLKGQLSQPMAIFWLKHNAGWSDKSQVDVTTQGDKINTINLNIIKPNKEE